MNCHHDVQLGLRRSKMMVISIKLGKLVVKPAASLAFQSSKVSNMVNHINFVEHTLQLKNSNSTKQKRNTVKHNNITVCTYINYIFRFLQFV
jgi:hypothetical protein